MAAGPQLTSIKIEQALRAAEALWYASRSRL